MPHLGEAGHAVFLSTGIGGAIPVNHHRLPVGGTGTCCGAHNSESELPAGLGSVDFPVTFDTCDRCRSTTPRLVSTASTPLRSGSHTRVRPSRRGGPVTIPSDTQLREILVDMVTARTQSGRLWNLQRQGQVGTVAPIDGHEATIVAAAHALDTDHDWVVPQYREPLALRRYGPEILERFMLYCLGHPAGGHIPDPIRVLPNQISLGTQIPHAVGIAWGMVLRSEPGIALVFFGDGSSSEGDFYEAGNLAGVLNAPVVMVCVNNQWAISTPVHLQTAAESFADKAAGFGIPGVKVDGNDAAAVYDAVDEARKHALAGKGPTLIEAVIYRLGAHTTADDPTRYVPPEDLEAARRDDPVLRLSSQLRSLGLWDDAAQQETEAVALELLDRAVEEARSAPLAADALLDHCLSADTQRLARQRSQLLGTHSTEAGDHA